MPGLAWSGELPFELKVAIAEAVTLFSPIDDVVRWAALAALRQERNMIAHGVRGMSEGVPTVIWQERMLEPDEFETAELYDYERPSYSPARQ